VKNAMYGDDEECTLDAAAGSQKQAGTKCSSDTRGHFTCDRFLQCGSLVRRLHANAERRRVAFVVVPDEADKLFCLLRFEARVEVEVLPENNEKVLAISATMTNSEDLPRGRVAHEHASRVGVLVLLQPEHACAAVSNLSRMAAAGVDAPTPRSAHSLFSAPSTSRLSS
jgi:hypothetical protein